MAHAHHLKAGFPAHQLDRFLKILVQDLQEHVALCEEIRRDSSDTIDRRVTRIITPGTLIDEKFMDPLENNFLLAIRLPAGGSTRDMVDLPRSFEEVAMPASVSEKPAGIAWLDISTGDFFTQSTTFGSLSSDVARVAPREIVMTEDDVQENGSKLLSSLELHQRAITRHKDSRGSASFKLWSQLQRSEVSEEESTSFTPLEIDAANLLLSYVNERFQGLNLSLQPPVRHYSQESMIIDKNTMRALELLGTSKEGLGGGKGSLLHTLRGTVTKSGSRLLRSWIASPSMSLETINARLDIVSTFVDDRLFREALTMNLKRTFDSQRIVQKFAMGRGDADDLVSLLKTIDATAEIARLFGRKLPFFDSHSSHHDPIMPSDQSLYRLQARISLDGPKALADLIRSCIDEEGLIQTHRMEDSDGADILSSTEEIVQNAFPAEEPSTLLSLSKSKAKKKLPGEAIAEDQDVWILRKTASPELEDLHQIFETLLLEKVSLTHGLREELKADSLSLRWTPGLGYICHVKGARDLSSTMHRSTITRDVKTTKSTRSFHHPSWDSLGSRIDGARKRIRAEEQQVLRNLRGQVVSNLVQLRGNGAVLDELDVACAFAVLAEAQSLKRPVVKDGGELNILGGRHATVKVGLEEQGRAFVSNDCHLGRKERVWLITGPNMAGKSTFLRQNALISVLAQIGCFVPAEDAEIGLVDQIFTRVGSADNLFRDQSTFMVEMMETATILKNATARSFVIMDEIGRGTTPEDGVAISFACLHHLYYKIRCRTLFATHFHTLADMTAHFDHLGCYCTDIAEGSGGSFSFVHRLRPGVNRSSHALRVAALAGVPEAAIETARNVLETLGHQSKTEAPDTAHTQGASH